MLQHMGQRWQPQHFHQGLQSLGRLFSKEEESGISRLGSDIAVPKAALVAMRMTAREIFMVMDVVGCVRVVIAKKQGYESDKRRRNVDF
jgi:hypothetical protein